MAWGMGPLLFGMRWVLVLFVCKYLLFTYQTQSSRWETFDNGATGSWMLLLLICLRMSRTGFWAGQDLALKAWTAGYGSIIRVGSLPQLELIVGYWKMLFFSVAFIWLVSSLEFDGLNIPVYDFYNGCKPLMLDAVLRNYNEIKLYPCQQL